MDNQNPEDVDEDYDELLEDNFEDDFDDFDDEIEATGSGLLEDDLDDDDDFLGGSAGDDDEEEEEEDWDLLGEGDDIEAGLGAEKDKSDSALGDLSFNTKVIIGAVVLGVCVLVYQLVTTKPEITVDAFVSALSMDGISDGPVFGESTIETNEIESADIEKKEETKGFLHEPDVLNSMQTELQDSPPMPTPITEEQPGNNSSDSSKNVVMPMAQPEKTEMANEEKSEDIDQIPQVPRPPEDVKVPDIGETEKQESPAKKNISEVADITKLPNAEDFLKAAIEARSEKDQTKKEENEKQAEPITQKESVEIPEIPNKDEKKIKIEDIKDLKISNKNPEISTQDSMQISSDVEEKLSMIVSRLENMESQIEEIKQGDNSQIENMNEKLSTLEKEMEEIGSMTASVKKQEPKQETKKQTPVKKTKAVTPKKKATAKKPATSSSRWELRAAQPGKAWVAKSGQNNMQPVVVGDSLSGIGRVTSISFNGSRWVVVGTSGQILQK